MSWLLPLSIALSLDFFTRLQLLHLCKCTLSKFQAQSSYTLQPALAYYWSIISSRIKYILLLEDKECSSWTLVWWIKKSIKFVFLFAINELNSNFVPSFIISSIFKAFYTVLIFFSLFKDIKSGKFLKKVKCSRSISSLVNDA